MAVIRETQQFKIGSIGVARASQGGQIVGEAISSAANDIAGMLFKAGADRAEKAGLEAAASTDRAAIITINPKTGQPEAFSPPQGFGGIASDAYQRVIRSRFQQSIEEEIKLKAGELAVQFEESSNAVGLYETAMADYIASMSNNATGEFSGYIKDVGTSYLNATRASLAISQIRREREAAKKASIRAAEQANEAIEAFVTINGPGSFGGEEVTEAEFIGESANAAIADGESAGLFSRGEVNAMNMDQRLAVARGAIRNVSESVTDSNDLRKIQYAIGTQDLSAIPEQYGFLRDSLALIAQTPSSFAEIEQFSNGVLADRVQLVSIYEQEAEAEAKAAQAARVFDITQSSNVNASASRTVAASPDIRAVGIGANAASEYYRLTSQSQQALLAGNEEESKAILTARDEILGATVEGLVVRALRGLTPEEAIQVEAAVFNGNPQLAPDSARDSVSAVLRLANSTDTKVLDQFSSEVRSYKEGPARAAELELKISAAALAEESVVPAINAISVTRFGDLDAAVASAVSDVDGIRGLDDGVASSYKKEAYYRASLSAASTFYQTNPTKAQMDAAMGFIQTGDVGPLTPLQEQILSKARGYTDNSGRLAELRTYMNGRASARVEGLNKLAADQAKAEKIFNLGSGLGNPAKASDRELASEYITNRFEASLEGQSLSQVLLSGSEASIPILSEIKRINVLPDELHQAFSSLASGSLMVNSSPVLLSHWRTLRTQVTISGNEIMSPAVESLSAEQVATLDALSEYGRVYGDSTEVIAEALSPLRRYNSEKAYREVIDGFYDDGVDSFLQSVDGVESLPPSAYAGFRSAAIRYAALSDSMGYNEGSIRDRLERQIEITYPDGDGYVYSGDMGRRSPASLSRIVPGNERDFISYAQSLVQTQGLSETGQPIDLPVFAMNPVEADQLREEMIRSGRGAELKGMTTLFLQPIGRASREGTQYRVMRFNPKSALGREPVLRKQNGMMVPFVVSTNDPSFVSMVKAKGDKSSASTKERAESRMRIFEMIGASTGANR